MREIKFRDWKKKIKIKFIFDILYGMSLGFWILIVTVVCLSNLMDSEIIMEKSRWLPIILLLSAIFILLKSAIHTSLTQSPEDDDR